MSIQGKSLAVLTPMYGGFCTRLYHQSAVQLMFACKASGVDWTEIGTENESLIPRARNRLVDAFLKNTEFSHAVFIDADIGFDPRDILAMLEFDKDIIGAGCVKKSIDWERVQRVVRQEPNRQYTPDELSRIGGQFVINWEHTNGKKTFSLGEPCEVKHLGTGLLMVRRNVFDEFIEKYPDRWYDSSKSDPASLPGPTHDFFQTGVNPDTREYDSEDYWFCANAKAIGFKVWLCPWMKTTHQGTYTFTGDLPAIAALCGGNL